MTKPRLVYIVAAILLTLFFLWLIRGLDLDRAGWVEGKPCAIPCWMHITPGETTLQEARHLLGGGILGLLRRAHEAGNLLIAKDLDGNSITLTFSGEPAIIRSIEFAPAKLIPSEELLATFGEPTHVLAFALRSTTVECTSYAYNFLFMSHGLEVHWQGNGNCQRPTGMSVESYQFRWVRLFEPSVEGYRNSGANTAWADMLKPFDGSYDFGHYCVGDRCSDDPH